MKLTIFDFRIDITKQCLPTHVYIEKIDNGFLIGNTFFKNKEDCIAHMTKLLKKTIK